MKIAVITMHAVKNYGSVLQTYATQEILLKMGCDVEIINYIREKNLNSNLAETWTNNDHGVKKIVKKIVLLPTIHRWIKVFDGFLTEAIHLTPNVYLKEKDFKSIPLDADVYCTGSDQVWNSGWNLGVDKNFYLNFAPEDSKRISIAASIGRTTISDAEKEIVLPLLKKYDYITVRELSGVKLLKNLGLGRVGFCLDPTLLLTKDEWLKHAVPYKIKKKFLLVYQLNHDERFDDYVVKLAKRKCLDLVRVCTRFDQCRLPGRAIIIPKVGQLLDLIDKAELVVTNSFHATAFCINFNKDFIDIRPNEYSCRINDVLELFDLQERCISDYNNFDIANKQINYDKINSILTLRRKESLDAIKNMLAD